VFLPVPLFRLRPRLNGGATDHPGTQQWTPALPRHLALPLSRLDGLSSQWSLAPERLRLIVPLG